MDPESTFARVERTWWTVWYYITGAVNRFLRPSPADTEDIDPNSFHESTEHRDPPDRSHEEEDDSVGRVLDEEQSFAKASEHGSFCSVVASNICTADIHLRPDNKSTECKKQLSGGTEDGEGTREERLDLTGNDDTGPPAAEGVAEIITLYTCRQDEKNEGRAEHKSDDVEKSEGNTGTEEEEVKVVPTVMLDNGQKVDETITEEQEDIMLHEDEQCLEEEGIDIIELRPEEEESIHRGETGAQMDDEVAVVTAVDTDVVLHESEVTEEDVKQPSVCEELLVMSEDESAVTGQERPMARCSEIEDEGEQEEEKISDAANNQQTDEVPEQGKDTTTEKHMLMECVPCSEEGVQNAEQDDVAVTEMQTKTRDTAVTVSPETGQEIREFKNISPGTSESPVVMLQEVNTPTCEETQEGVPEYNNELRPDENLTQKILEVEDCEEIQTFQLPEEEGESLQKGGSLLVREPMEENQESITGDISWSVGTASQESGRLCEEEEGKLQESSMKTEFQTTEELQGETEELLVHFGTDEVLYDSKDAAEEVCDMKGDTAVEEEVRDPNEKFQKMPENSFFDESGQALATEQNNIRTLFKGDITDSGFLRHSGETERELLEEMQEERDHVGEMQKKNQQVVVSEVSLHLERQDNQSPGMTVEMSEKEEMIKDAETADESNTSQSIIEEHVTETEASPRHQDVIDEELLDLWIETAMSEDTDNIRQQEGPEQEQQMDTEADLSPDKVSPKKEMEQLMESHSGESAFISDTEISSSTVESESLDQSLGEWGTQNLNEAQLQKPTSSLQGIDDMLLVSAPQSNSESHVDLMEGRATTEQYPDSGVSSPQMTHLNEESDKSQGSTEETGSQRDMEVTDMAGVSEWKDTEQAEVTKMRSPFQVEEKEVNDEPLVSDSPDEITHTEFISDSVEEEIILNEATSQSKEMLEGPQPGWLGKMSQDLNEVDAPLLDFTVQKSRIAVKNPLIRPPKDPRSLLNMPSADPTPSPRVPIKAAAGVPLGGLGIGIKLPGIGAGFPVLKKTKVEKDDNKQELISQETEKKPQETSEAPQQDEVQHKPKWMPPRHPGFGNPLMSELKTKLKKTTKE
ncbi:uncharacterized protein LOC114451720 isoform X2 [Parambassis ranga]|uniref:Uncharacterized protein LOC114451720 isoform X2 n=1 Tax=Parambassis ranga TaxID=210632 RepID=A0A6P7KA75_9TELE|nr:uncharacterized protein LOC114451720 isoform X2 [Parambassis ranga]